MRTKPQVAVWSPLFMDYYFDPDLEWLFFAKRNLAKTHWAP